MLSYTGHASTTFRSHYPGPSAISTTHVRILHASDRAERILIAEAVNCIQAGGTLIFPTETVYGIGAAAENEAAVAAVYAAKGRSFDKPLALHVSDMSQARPFVARWTRSAQRAADHFWPGPLAIVVERKAQRFAKAAAGIATISLRCPDHALCNKMLMRTGALAATSANLSGAAAFTGVGSGLGDLPQATLAIIAGPTRLQRESTIMDCSHEQPRVLRWGAIDRDRLEAVMGTLGPHS